MYDQQLGSSLNYGQSMQPGKTSSGSYMDYQLDTYGKPKRKTAGDQQPAQQANGTPIMPNGQPQIPQQPTQGTVDNNGIYKPGQAPTATYQQMAIPQFQMPNFGNVPQLQQGLLEKLLQSPSSLSPEVISQMKGDQRNTAALLQKQTLGDLSSSLASRGIASNEGYGLGQQRAVMQDTNRGLLDSFRNIDINAANTNHQDLINALGLADQFQNTGLNRASTGYGNMLQGMGLQGQQQQNYLNSLLANYNAGLQGSQLASQSALSAKGNELQGQSINNQMSQFLQNLGFQKDQFQYTKDQNALQMQQQQAAANAANDRWADQQAYQYQKDQEDEFNSLLSYLMGGGGGQ